MPHCKLLHISTLQHRSQFRKHIMFFYKNFAQEKHRSCDQCARRRHTVSIIGRLFAPRERNSCTYIINDAINSFIPFNIVGNHSKAKLLDSISTEVQKCFMSERMVMKTESNVITQRSWVHVGGFQCLCLLTKDGVTSTLKNPP